VARAAPAAAVSGFSWECWRADRAAGPTVGARAVVDSEAVATEVVSVDLAAAVAEAEAPQEAGSNARKGTQQKCFPWMQN